MCLNMRYYEISQIILLNNQRYGVPDQLLVVQPALPGNIKCCVSCVKDLPIKLNIKSIAEDLRRPGLTAFYLRVTLQYRDHLRAISNKMKENTTYSLDLEFRYSEDLARNLSVFCHTADSSVI